MEPQVVDLIRDKFNRLSNHQIMMVAADRKIALQCYCEGFYLDEPIILRYPGSKRKNIFFKAADFRSPRFVKAIEDFVISTSREILEIAPEKGISTAVKQIFGTGALEIIEDGRMPVTMQHTPIPRRKVTTQAMPFHEHGSIIPFSSLALRRG